MPGAGFVFLAIPFLRDLPVRFTQWLADLATQRKIYALICLALGFVVIPLLCVFATKGL
jgi:sodium-dependent phosphate cotransporter